MKILMVNVPFSGHVNPTLVLAEQLVERGHSVSYILTNQWKEKVKETGATFIPYHNADDYEIVFKNGKPRNFLSALKAWKYIYETILEVGEDYDLLIYEFFSFTAFSAARKLKLRTVRMFTTFAVSRDNIGSILVSRNKEINLLNKKMFLSLITKLVCGNVPLTTPNILTEITDVSPGLNIVCTSKDFQEDSKSFDETYHFVGPLIGSKRVSEMVIPFNQMKEKIIYISLGTLQNQNIAFYKKCVDAFKNSSEISVVMSVGKNTNIRELGNLPRNFYVYPYVPQLEVLKNSSLFITHGGMNSVNEGLFYANPLIVIPLDMDQFAVADRVAQLRLGVRLDMDRVTPELLYSQAGSVLHNSEISDNVKRMSELMKAGGGAKRAAELIEQYMQGDI